MQPQPVVYEINTWPWLAGLARQLGRPMSLASVPDEVWDELGPVDAVWLMGVWQRSPAGVRVALADARLVEECGEALPDFTPADIVGSPYCIRDYIVDDHLGGPAGLAVARTALARRGITLILDFVPNHLAIDHRWTSQHPESCVTGSDADIADHPDEYVRIGDTVIANGRDPHFAPWRDVVQLNVFNPETRARAIDTLRTIAGQCDGVRCDMAMLVCNEIFAQTWRGRVSPAPDLDYWNEIIPAVRAAYPDFVFIAESYWGTHGLLRSQGFDFCYDKEFTDTLVQRPCEVVTLIGDGADRSAQVHFLENHDEPRAQAVFGSRHRTAAITALTQPGARLIYDGQRIGRVTRLPVQLAREPTATADMSLAAFYHRLLHVIAESAFHTGEFTVLQVSGWADRPVSPALVAWSWAGPEQRWLIVVNLDDSRASGVIWTPWPELRGAAVVLTDPVGGEVFERPAVSDQSIAVTVPAWGAHVLRVEVALSGEGDPAD